MKKILIIVLSSLVVLVGVFMAYYYYQMSLSPQKTLKAKMGSTDVEIVYCAPSVKGRIIYGHIVPYNTLWRAGANAATTIEFSTNVSINGQPLKAGKYAFFVLPKEKGEWEVLFNAEPKQWGTYDLSKFEDKNVLQISTASKTIESQEILDYKIVGNQIILSWDKRAISMLVETAS